MTTVVEGLYIFTADSFNCILSHIYTSRPPLPAELASRLRGLSASSSSSSSSTSPAKALPAVLYLPDLLPPTTVHTLSQAAGLVLCLTSSRDGNTLAFVTFLQRVVDILEDFLGSPLLASKIESNYSIVAQLLTEICDAGIICNTEPNSLHDQVKVSSGLVNKLFNQVGIPPQVAAAVSSTAANAPSLSALSSTVVGLSSSSALSSSSLTTINANATALAIPWRRPNVRHTSNEVYVDMVESLSLLLAPSGRPIRYLARGSILFTCKISGVPDLVLTLSAPGGTSSSKSLGIQRAMATPSFHPCVRLNRWKENPGELSFIPPDGKFVLASYETDLLPQYVDDNDQALISRKNEKVFIPASVDLRTGLGPKGNEFEAKLRLDTRFGRSSTKHGAGSSTTGIGGSSSSNSSSAPVLDGVVVHIPFGDNVRTVSDLKASRGDAQWHVSKGGSGAQVEWKVKTSRKEAGGSVSGTAVLTGVVIGGGGPTAAGGESSQDKRALSEYYGDDRQYLTSENGSGNGSGNAPGNAPGTGSGNGNRSKTKSLMPQSISVSFMARGWLASGIRVDSLVVDSKKSRSLGEGVRPYKGVKYASLSRRGVERRVE